MPIDITSRYWLLPSYAVSTDGVVTTALPARPLAPDATAGASLYHHRVTGLETVEYLAWRFYGDSQAWWRVSDANSLAFPLDHPPGGTVRVARSADVGRVIRTRSL